MSQQTEDQGMNLPNPADVDSDNLVQGLPVRIGYNCDQHREGANFVNWEILS